MNPDRRQHSEAGSVTAELVILTPLLVLLVLFVVALGRLSGARINVDGAAAQAARAASIARTPTAATQAAQTVASAALADDHVTCVHLDVTVDTSSFTPGGAVAVSITCGVDLADLTGLRLPTNKTISGHAVAVVDQYRAAQP